MNLFLRWKESPKSERSKACKESSLSPGERVGRGNTANNYIVTGKLVLGICLFLASGGAGCRVVQSAADLPGDAMRVVLPGGKKDQGFDIVQLQHNLCRFSDEFAVGMLLATDKLRLGTNALSPEETLRWKIAITESAWGIAAGPDTLASLLDMVTMVTLTRMTVQDYWLPEVYGESARPMLETCQTAEHDIWEIADRILTPAQVEELHAAIEEYHATKPDPMSVLFVRAYAFETRLGKGKKQRDTESGSVFSLLMIDPLAGLSPATRELAQTRMFGERTVFLAQRMPRILRWEADLLALRTTELPAVQQLITNSTQLTASVGQFAAAADRLPGQLSAEREQILSALQSQEGELADLAKEYRQTLVAGTDMSTSLNTTITNFDALMKRFGVGEPKVNKPRSTNAEPLSIRDYTASAAQLEATAQRLTELLVTLDHTMGSTNLAQLSAQVGPAVQQAKSDARQVVDYAFWKGILLLACALLAALIYRFLVARTTVTRTRSNSS